MSNRPSKTECNKAIAWARLNQARYELLSARFYLDEACGAALEIDPECSLFASLGEIASGPMHELIESITELCDESPLQLELRHLSPGEDIPPIPPGAMPVPALDSDEVPLGD